MGSTGGRARASTIAAWGSAVTAVGLAAAALVLRASNASRVPDLDELYLADVWVSLVVPPIGAYLLTRTRARLLGAILLSTALLSLGGAGAMYAIHVTISRPEGTLASDLASWLATWTWTPYLLLIAVVPLLVPDGRPASPRLRLAVRCALMSVAVIAVASSVAPGPLDPFPRLENPLGIDAAPWLPAFTRGLIATTVGVCVPLGLVSVTIRWRRSGATEDRRHLTWLLAALAAMAVAVIGAESLPYPWYDLAPALGISVVLAALVAAVAASDAAAARQRAHEQLVVAREDERFRLHRDLHDGLGPELAGLALHLNAIGTAIEDGPLRGRLAAAEQTLRRTVQEVRRIVDDLRPPALDQLGLAGALDQQAAALFGDGSVDVELRVEGCPPQLPPAVEVAAYRIACEALTNVARHAGAARCRIELRAADGLLQVQVEDDGCGLAQRDRTGVGSRSMRSRAEELGGRLLQGPGAGDAGLRVTAILPLLEEAR